ncbi:MAG: hypothetical protein V4505_21125 [Pseudomonadota bacterium]
MENFNAPPIQQPLPALQECVQLFSEAATEPVVQGAYLFRLAAKAKDALDATFGAHNRHAAGLVHIVMGNVKSARDDVPAFVSAQLLHLMQHAAQMQRQAVAA